jgi:hypothetical protein
MAGAAVVGATDVSVLLHPARIVPDTRTNTSTRNKKRFILLSSYILYIYPFIILLG